jgi:hypothetical protein
MVDLKCNMGCGVISKIGGRRNGGAGIEEESGRQWGE